jgi:DNA-binding SARP family transcriptional activator/tetratricopeptide (TPR) repeat protein
VSDDPVSSLIETSLVLERSGSIGAAFKSAEQALENARASGIAASILKAHVRVAFLHFRLGHYERARVLAEEALAQDAVDSISHIDGWLVLGNCAAETDDLSAAADCYLRAIDLSRQLGYPLALMRGLHNLATGIYLPHGQFELALAADQEVARLANEHNAPKLYWGALVTIAWVYWLIGRDDLCAATVDELFHNASSGSLEEGYGLWLSGNLAQKTGFDDQALAHYSRARSIAEAIGEPGLGIVVRLGPSRCHREHGDAAAAREWADDALTMAVRAGYHHMQGLALIERGRAAWSLGDALTAGADWRAAIEMLQALNIHFDLARASLYLAAMLSDEKHPDAFRYWQQAAGLIQKYGYGFLLEEERALVLPWVASGLDSPDADHQKTCQDLFDRLQSTPPAPLQIETLGQFSIRVGARSLSNAALRQRRSGEVLAFLLASRGQTATAQQITDALCPDKAPGAAVVFYHHAVSALRRLFEPDLPDRRFPCRYLEVSEERVTLVLPPGSRIDFLAFRQHVQAREWAQAIALYRGEFLPMHRYAEWTLDLRQHLADQYEQALLAQAAESFAAGDSAACLEFARQALLHNPWQEQAAELGMRAALASGDRATALKLYRRLEKDLGKDLGIEPQAKLREIYQRIKNQ